MKIRENELGWKEIDKSKLKSIEINEVNFFLEKI